MVHDCPNHLYITAYIRKHTLWQALAPGQEIRLHANYDKSITVNLVCNGFVVASERPQFRTRKAQAAAMRYASRHNKLEIVTGNVVLV